MSKLYFTQNSYTNTKFRYSLCLILIGQSQHSVVKLLLVSFLSHHIISTRDGFMSVRLFLMIGISQY